MHHIHHTEAFILKSSNVREADKVLYLYTRELGLIKATAQGIRKLGSKLRFALQDFTYAKVDLVRGRATWRVTSAQPIDSLIYIKKDRASYAIVHNTSRLLLRLVQGEEAHEKIFNDLKHVFFFLNQIHVPRGERRATELSLVLRILHHLGYTSGQDDMTPITMNEYMGERSEYTKEKELRIISEINRALKATQL